MRRKGAIRAPARAGGTGGGRPPPEALVAAVQAAGERLCGLYALELEHGLGRFVVEAQALEGWLPPDAPRTGVAVMEEADTLWIGLYVDPRDRADSGTIVEETSHLVCLSWHAAQERPVTCLALELQAEVDRYALARLSGRDALAHFRRFRWSEGMSRGTRPRYETAHRVAHSYCRALQRRFPRRADTPALLAELRRFYRAAPQAKLRWSGA